MTAPLPQQRQPTRPATHRALLPVLESAAVRARHERPQERPVKAGLSLAAVLRYAVGSSPLGMAAVRRNDDHRVLGLKSVQLPTPLVILCLLGLVVAVRAPFWFPAVINWDESTFIIVAQAMLDGHLFYDRYWDLKPPLVFSAVAAFLYGLGDSIVAVRAGGALLVFGASLLVLLIARRLVAPHLAALCAALHVVASSVLYNGQATMSEHVAVLPLLAGVALLTARSSDSAGSSLIWRSAGVGLLIAAACLARLNLAYLAVALAVLVPLHPDHRTHKSRALALFAYGFGGLAAIGATLLPYVWSGQADLWWRTMVVAPLEYSGARYSWIEAARRLAKYALYQSWSATPFAVLLVGLGAGGLLCALRRISGTRGSERWSLIVLVVAFAATVFSTVVTGGAHDHYLLQIVPFLAIFAGLCLAAPAWPSRLARLSTLALLAAALLAFRPTVVEADRLLERLESERPLVYGPSVEAAAFIRSLALKDYTVYAMSEHIVYWLLDKPPPTPISTHPSNVFKPYLLRVLYGAEATPALELRRIFAEPPTIVVKERDVQYLRPFEAEAAQLAAYLDDYRLAFEAGTLQVLVRSEVLVRD